MSEEDALIAAIREAPTDDLPRLVYADWLDECGHPGADHLRTELALSRATGEEAVGLRRKLLALQPMLPPRWRDTFEQPDLLLAPPVPFGPGWYFARDTGPRPYRSLPNLELDMLDPNMPWLSGEGFEERLDQAKHEEMELKALTEVEDRATRLGLTLPPGFVSFARDFRRRGVVDAGSAYCEVCLQEAVVDPFPQVGDGYLIHFFADMNYGNPHQLTWSLYLVPGLAWHCVVVSELGDDTNNLHPTDPDLIFYCAPSFQAFLYRWWLENWSGR